MTRLHAELVLNNYFLLPVRATYSYNITDSVALLSLVVSINVQYLRM